MKQQEKFLLASVAIGAFVIGVAAFVTGAYLHQWHILGIPSCYVAAAMFVISNFATTAFLTLNLPMVNLTLKATISCIQATVLLLVVLGLQFVAPVCLLMLKSMMYPTMGIIIVSILALIVNAIAMMVKNRPVIGQPG